LQAEEVVVVEVVVVEGQGGGVKVGKGSPQLLKQPPYHWPQSVCLYQWLSKWVEGSAWGVPLI
jgi:hypothetical protein